MIDSFSPSRTAALRAALDRWQLPLAGFLLAALLLPGLGRNGLLDPWEMQRAAVARRMAAPPRVLVAEAPAHKLLTALEKEAPGRYGLLPASALRDATAQAALQQASVRLAKQVAHAVVVDLDAVLGATPEPEAIDQAGQQLAQIQGQNRGTALILVTERGTDKALRTGLALAQVRALQTDFRETPIGLALADSALPGLLAPAFAATLDLVPRSAAASSLAARCPSPWSMPVHKHEGQTVTVPWLEAALVATSLSVFGNSETAVRLPGALIAILTGLLLVLAARRLWGTTEGWLALIVFATLPLTWGLARTLTFEATAPLGVTLVTLGLALAAARRSTTWAAWVLAGAVILFLGKGLAGLTMATGIAVLYILATGDRARGPVLAALALVAALAGGAWWVLTHPDDLLLRSLRFTQWPFGGGPSEVHRDLGWFVGQTGFGLYPWGAPFAIGLATLLGAPGGVGKLLPDRPRPGAALLAGVLVPVCVAAVLIKNFHHFVTPVGPIAAVVTAAMLGDLLAGRISGRLVAVFTALGTLLLHREIGKGADAVTRFIAFDPPLQTGTGALVWPEELKLPRSLRAIALLAVLGFALGAAQPMATVRAALAKLRQPRAAGWALAVLGILWAIDVLVSLGTKLDVLLKTAATTSGYQYDRVWVTIQGLRPDVIAGGVVFGLLLAVAAVVTFGGRQALERRAPLRLLVHLGSMLQWAPLALGLVAVAAVSVLVAGGMVHVGVRGEGWGAALGQGARSAAFAMPLLLALLAGAGWLLARRVPQASGAGGSAGGGNIAMEHEGLTSSLRVGLYHRGPLLVGMLGLCALAGLGIGASQAGGTWTYGYLAAVWALAAALALVILGHAQDRPGGYGWPLLAWGLVVVASLAAPLGARYWQEAVTLAQDPGARGDTLRYFGRLLVASTDTALLWVLAVLVLVNRLADHRPRLRRWVTRGVDSVAALERPWVAALALALAGVTFSAGYAGSLLPGLSVHYSQKHLLLRIEEAGGSGKGPEGAPRTYTHGSTRQGDDNFYTQSMPSIDDRQAVLALLAGENMATRITDSGEGGGSRVITLAGWSDRTDRNKDQKRDAPAWFGVASEVDGVLVKAAKPGWQQGQWKGASLFSAEGPGLAVVDNSMDSLTIAAPPALVGEDPVRGAFALDRLPNATAQDAKHSAAAPLPRFVVVPKDGFSELNHAFRSAHGGRQIAVLDAASSRLVLATSQLQPGQTDENWLAKAVLTQAQFDAVPGVKRIFANFDNQLHLIGYKLAEASVARSQKYKLTVYWKVHKPTPTSWKQFMHPHPLHLDRWPLTPPDPSEDENKPCNGCFQTNHWLEGDIIADSFEQEVPLGTNAGPSEIILGWYNPGNDQRMTLLSASGEGVVKHGDNRVTIGHLQVR